MEKVYRFRILLDQEEDVFRDIDMRADHTFEDFHSCILQVFGFDGSQMASFYETDESWTKGREIALMDMSFGMESEQDQEILIMGDTPLEDLLAREKQKLLYVYDFLLMWCFYIELSKVFAPEDGVEYPMLIASHGENPDPDAKLTGLSMPGNDPTGLDESDESSSEFDMDDPYSE